MKKLIFTAAILLAAQFSIRATAQPVSEPDQKGIEALYGKIRAAFTSLDAAAMAGLYTDDGTHIDPMGNITHGRKAIQTMYEQLFGFFKSQPKPEKSEHHDSYWNNRYLVKNLVLVTYVSEDVDTRGDKANSHKFAMSVILKKTDNAWLCVQVTMTPVTTMPK